MRVTTRKAQVMLTDYQYNLLREHAREQGKSVSEVVRESLEETLLKELETQRRLAAVERLSQMNGWVPDTVEELRELLLDAHDPRLEHPY